MIPETTLAVTLLSLIDRIYALPANLASLGRGRPNHYPDALFLKGAVLMHLKHVHTAHGLLAMLEQPTSEMRRLKQLLSVDGRLPSRRTWERRLDKLTAYLARAIVVLGHMLVELLEPFATRGRAVAIDSTPLSAYGRVWHQRDRKAGRVPFTNIDTAAHWSKSGWQGWWYGWKLHLVCTTGPVPIPLAASLTAANVGDNVEAVKLLPLIPKQVRYVLGDSHYHGQEVQALCASYCFNLVCSRGKRKAAANDVGKEVRYVLHKTRSTTIERWNGQYKGLFTAQGRVPTRGEQRSARFALSGVVLQQLMMWHRHLQGLHPTAGLLAALRAG